MPAFMIWRMIWLSSHAARCARVSLLALFATGTTSSGESTGPNGTRLGINVIAGANVSDTIDAVLPEPLRVVVRDQAGDVLAGAIVRFSSVPGSWRGYRFAGRTVGVHLGR